MTAKSRVQEKTAAKRSIGDALKFEELRSLATELKELRDSPPVVTTGPGRREGDILAFVRGLRISARVAYFLRDALSDTDLEVSWAHLLDDNQASCSPECDIVIHSRGYLRKWNGKDRPIMDFRFIEARAARAVISCKSLISSVEQRYPKQLKQFGVKKVFLFAECCDEKKYATLREKARKAGYAGLYCLYMTKAGAASFTQDETQYANFVKDVRRAVGSQR